MDTAIVTGSGGLIGSESVRALVESGWDVIGLENDMRARFFGPEASTSATTERLERDYGEFRSSRSTSATPTRSIAPSATLPAVSGSSSTPPRSRPTTGPRAIRRPTSG